MKATPLPLDQLTDGLRTVLEYWRGLGGETLACSWDRFELTALPSDLLPTTMVIDIAADMADNRYRFWGTRMTVIHGRDMTGRSPYDIEPADMAAAVRKQHTNTIKERRPGATVYEFVRASGAVHRHHALRLPLSKDGETVNQLVVVVDLSGEGSDYMKGQFSGDPTRV